MNPFPPRIGLRAATLGLAAALAGFGGLALAGRAVGDRLVVADPDAPTKGSPLAALGRAQGWVQFQQHCARCHGADARGDAGRGVPDLTDADWLYGSGKASEIEAVIAHGVRAEAPKSWKLADMPAFGRPRPSATDPSLKPLSPGAAADVAQYVLALGGRPHDRAAAGRGRTDYLGAGGCFDCHGGDGRGDPGIGAPNLTDGVWLYGRGSAEEIRRSILDGRRGHCPAWAGRLGGAEIREIALYVRALSATSPPPLPSPSGR